MHLGTMQDAIELSASCSMQHGALHLYSIAVRSLYSMACNITALSLLMLQPGTHSPLLLTCSACYDCTHVHHTHYTLQAAMMRANQAQLAQRARAREVEAAEEQHRVAEMLAKYKADEAAEHAIEQQRARIKAEHKGRIEEQVTRHYLLLLLLIIKYLYMIQVHSVQVAHLHCHVSNM
jgi:hypothetical protein